ncbi:leptin [Molothrus aeneus]|uniref:leptin n=1 Tax=Molothrus ater TaxID=84834 RepID=UPI00174E1A92|nr:leptin [Molothrus ater]XP_036257189.1 leptin-like [Molothrus ater]XP_054370815.1 leptin [Molothrus ater]XP_054488328.1 leptin [Agelaius phoeniceus]
MRGPGASLRALLCLAVALAVGGGRPVRLERVRADARALTRTLSTRLQQLQLFPLTLRISGLEGVPEGALPDGGAPPGLGWAAQRLQLFQRLLAALPGADLRLAQVANDLENLRSLLAVLGALLGCPAPREPPPAPPAPPNEAPHTLAGVALARLRGCLDGVAARLEGVPAC